MDFETNKGSSIRKEFGNRVFKGGSVRASMVDSILLQPDAKKIHTHIRRWKSVGEQNGVYALALYAQSDALGMQGRYNYILTHSPHRLYEQCDCHTVRKSDKNVPYQHLRK